VDDLLAGIPELGAVLLTAVAPRAYIDLNRAADELSLATDYLAGVFPLRFESTNAVANAIAVATAFQLPEDYYTTYRDRIRSLTTHDIERVAAAHLHPGELLVVAVGNATEIRRPLELLEIGEVEVRESHNSPEGV